MFNSSYEELRSGIVSVSGIQSLVQIGFNSFPTLNSKIALAAAFVVHKRLSDKYLAKFFNCNDVSPAADKELIFREKLDGGQFFLKAGADFYDLPGSPISYWVGDEVRKVFRDSKLLGRVAPAKQGLSTSDNEKFVRLWHEVSIDNVDFDRRSSSEEWTSGCRWVPYNKGGLVRRWYGNNEFLVDWKNNGETIKGLAPKSVVRNEGYYFKESITWSDITIDSAFRLQDGGFVFANSAHSAFCNEGENPYVILGLLNSPVVEFFIGALSQSLHFDVGYYNVLPYPSGCVSDDLVGAVCELVEISRNDWNSREISWSFRGLPIVSIAGEGSICEAFERQVVNGRELKLRNLSLEDVVAKCAYEAYGLHPEDQLCNPRFVVEDIDRKQVADRLCSYIIGCAMGRFSLDEYGLIYAHNSGVGFDPSRYIKFPADVDGIIPITDEPWFEDDVAERVREFVKVVWGDNNLVENMEWLADSLGRKSGEPADEAIRRYLSTSFYKDHLQTYKKRPIYWLFSREPLIYSTKPGHSVSPRRLR
ncbi:hypothetical protein [Geopseudomonas aromaticivorans]